MQKWRRHWGLDWSLNRLQPGQFIKLGFMKIFIISTLCSVKYNYNNCYLMQMEFKRTIILMCTNRFPMVIKDVFAVWYHSIYTPLWFWRKQNSYNWRQVYTWQLKRVPPYTLHRYIILSNLRFPNSYHNFCILLQAFGHTFSTHEVFCNANWVIGW